MATPTLPYAMMFFDAGEPISDLSPTVSITEITGGLTYPASAINPLATDVASTAVQIDVVAAARTYTRASGDFTTDFAVGDWVLPKNFANGGNNTVGKVETVTATVMTLENRTALGPLVNETGSGDEVITKLVPGVYVALTVLLSPSVISWDAGRALVSYSRYQVTPTGPADPYTADPILRAPAFGTFAVAAGTFGEAIRAAASTLYTRLEAKALGAVNNKTVLTYVETAYYEDDTFTTEVMRLEHTPTYDPTSAVLEATSNEKT